MTGKTDVYRVVYVDGDGNHQALVFQEPTEGKSYKAEQMFNLDAPGWAATNDEGDIPHREQTSDGEDLGLTWHFQK